MKIGIISDSHDNLPNLRHALARLTESGVTTLIHCGDLISPFVTKELNRFEGRVHTVFGNNDADRFLAQKFAASNVTHHGEFGFVEAGGLRLGFTHYKEYAVGFAASGQCDVGLFGHTHAHESLEVSGRLVLNPGELLGMLGRPGFCILDTETRRFEQIRFDHQPWG